MSDEIIQTRLEADARQLPVLTGPETRGFKPEDAYLTSLPPEPTRPDIPGLDMSKPEIGGACPVCGRALPVDATPKNTPDGVFLCCRTCTPPHPPAP